MNREKELVNWLKLCNIKGLGPRKLLRLFAFFRESDAIINASPDELMRTRNFNETMLKNWLQLKSASSEKFEKIIYECKKNNITILPIISSEYPFQLKNMPSPPKNLFLEGNIDLLYSKKVAIVGSRNSDDDAKKWAFDKAVDLARKDIVIVSGGAKGIDYEVHRGALSVSGKTICVMGSGLLKLYPEEHIELFDEIRKTGLLVSEHLPNFTGGRIALLRRNRITSGISDAMISVTSTPNGGSMTQLKHAHDQRIPIFCPKNSLHFIPSEGINEVKKEYKIIEIEDIKPVLEVIDKKQTYSSPKQSALL
jgi:DNA processing protein